MTRPALLALALASTLLTACGGGDAEPAADDAPAVQGSAVAVDPAPSSPGASAEPVVEGSTAPAETAGPPPVDADGSPGPAAAAPRATAAPAASSPAVAAARTAAPASRATASRATAPGDYVYDSRGTVTLGAGAPRQVEGTATLTVDPPEGDRQSAVVQGDQGRTETDAVLRPDGRYLARLLLTTPAFSKEFRPAPPVLLLPEPLDAGRSWTFTLRSTDGKTTATARNRVLRSEDVTVGGRRVPTRVVQTQLSLRGDIVYDGTTTTNYAPEQRLPVRERGQGRGTVSGVPFETDTTRVLRSVEPS